MIEFNKDRIYFSIWKNNTSYQIHMITNDDKHQDHLGMEMSVLGSKIIYHSGYSGRKEARKLSAQAMIEELNSGGDIFICSYYM